VFEQYSANNLGPRPKRVARLFVEKPQQVRRDGDDEAVGEFCNGVMRNGHKTGVSEPRVYGKVQVSRAVDNAWDRGESF
jgi:hypothetical protein